MSNNQKLLQDFGQNATLALKFSTFILMEPQVDDESKKELIKMALRYLNNLRKNSNDIEEAFNKDSNAAVVG